MKNLLIGSVIVLLSAFGCRDKTPELVDSIKIEDLLGTWVSVDSAIIQNSEGDFVYVQDTFLFSSDSFTNNIGQTGAPVLHRDGYRKAYYLFKIQDMNNLELTYFGPYKQTYQSQHQIIIDDNLITLSDMIEFYPQTPFNKFIKIQ